MSISRKIRSSRHQCDLVHVINSPYLLTPIFGGQVEFMRSRGVHAQFVTSPGPELEAFAREEQVTVHEEKIVRTISPLQDVCTIIRLWYWLHRRRPDIVHAHTPKGGLIGMVASVLSGVSVRIYHIHGMPFETARGLRRRLLWLAEWFACRAAHRVLCVSHSMRDIAVQHGICPKEKIVVLGKGSANGIDAHDRFNPHRISEATRLRHRTELGIPADAKVIGFVGRLNREKGIVELSEAWQRIRQSSPKVHLLLVGPRDYKDAVPQQLFDQLDADMRVHMTGYQADTASLYTAMDVFVLPSYREGLPTVVLEAMAMARPIVATQIPGCVDVLDDGVTGTLIAVKNEPQIANAVIRYLENPALGRHHGNAARNHVLEHFSREQIWQATLTQYRELLEFRDAQPVLEFVPKSEAAIEPRTAA